MIRLGVNVDHVATVRQARRERIPSLIAACHAALVGGADQITMHLREDRRHVQDRDVELAAETLAVDLNLEMACTDAMVEVATRVKPAQVCLVPERREELTTEGGLDVEAHADAVTAAVDTLREAGVSVSLFVDPDERMLLAANAAGAAAVELHTGRYANARGEARRVAEFLALRKAAASAKELGLRVHAGHGLEYENVGRIAGLPEVEELNIGFAIVARALFVGMTEATRQMAAAIREGRRAAAEVR